MTYRASIKYKILIILQFVLLVTIVSCSNTNNELHDLLIDVEMITSMGTITLELNYSKAPVSVGNFLDYIKTSFYDSTIFHRVIDHFIIQGGQYNIDLSIKEPNEPIICESDNGLSNLRGTIAVARRAEPDTGISQFFINLVDNTNLDYQNDENRIGYAVFGRVVDGMDVVDAIAGVTTSTQELPDGGSLSDVPVTPVIVLSTSYSCNIWNSGVLLID